MMTKPILGYEERYVVFDDGKIFRVLKNGSSREIRGTIYSHGYVMICLSRDGNVARRFAHSIVAQAFIGPRPKGTQIDHIDGNKLNNAASNLRYVTSAENIRSASRLGLMPNGERNGQAKLTEDQVAKIIAAKKSGARYWGRNELAATFGVHPDQVARVANGRAWHCAEAIRNHEFTESAGR